jgi:penicillin-binding protein 1B
VRLWLPTRGWLRYVLATGLALGVVGLGVIVYLWASYGKRIDASLAGEQQPIPRIFGRPFELDSGEGLTPRGLVEQLNDIGYAERAVADAPGEFSVDETTVVIRTRSDKSKDSGRTVTVDFGKKPATRVARISVAGNKGVETLSSLTLEAPLLAALAPGERRRYVPLASIPRSVIDAVLTIEDRRFYDHAGVDPIRIGGALFTNLFGDKPYLEGGSTLTQQLARNFFLTDEMAIEQQTGRRSPVRKLREQFMSIVLETRITKDQILELYLNDVVLGRRGPFDIHGVSEASRIFFGKDVRNVTLAEAATIAGVIQSPSRLSPFRNPERARERRNIVLREMAATGVAPAADVERAMKEPLKVSTRSLENEAPYFVDYVSQLIEEEYAGLLSKDAAVDVYTTIDLHLQRVAQEVVADGVVALDKQLASRKRAGTPQVALVALNPANGELLAMVGGRSYNQSQYNRAVVSRRQPGSVFKPFVYLTAFEQMAAEGRNDITPATVFTDEPTTFKDGEADYTPANYQNEYDGPMTLRRALALSRNVIAIKVAESVGYNSVATLWKRVGLGTPAKAYPSIALGVFEVSPIEMATAYTIFANGGTLRPLQTITRILEDGKSRPPAETKPRSVARADTTFLVANMMRSVINEGTGASARSAGFTHDAAGKSGTTNDLRDAWFIGLTPQLLTAVWVGFDDNKPIGLSGSQAALPIWTAFMKRALSGRPSQSFPVPDGIVFAEIDKDTGQLATAACPRVFREAFLAGTEPHDTCSVHGGSNVFSNIGGLFRNILR